MDEQTRYRVTGSLFLLAVAIICLPMIFDGEGEVPLQIEPLDVSVETPAVRALDAVAPGSDLIARADDLRGRYDAEGFSASGGGRIGEPELTRPDENTKVWAVQVASFSDVGNAMKLRDQLRGQGFEAFISTARRGDGIVNRVAVGPLLNSSDAEAMQTRLAESLSTDVRLMAFSN